MINMVMLYVALAIFGSGWILSFVLKILFRDLRDVVQRSILR